MKKENQKFYSVKKRIGIGLMFGAIPMLAATALISPMMFLDPSGFFKLFFIVSVASIILITLSFIFIPSYWDNLLEE